MAEGTAGAPVEPEPHEPRKGAEEVEATPLGPGERGAGPTIDAPPPPRGSGPGPGPSTGASTCTGPLSGGQWAMIAHLSGLLAVPTLYVASIVLPLVVSQIRRADPEVVAHAKEALNFQLNMLVWMLITTPVAIVLGMATCCLGVFPPFVVQAYAIAMAVIAAVRASEGQRYRYPLILRLVD